MILESMANENCMPTITNEDAMQDMINAACGFSTMCDNEAPIPSLTKHRDSNKRGKLEFHNRTTGDAKEFYDLLKNG